MFYLRFSWARAAMLNGLRLWALLACVGVAWEANAVVREQTFPVLQIGTTTYTNVTITTKTRNYIMLLHAGGMSSLKVSDLPVEVREKLGYVDAQKAKPATNLVSAWTKEALAKVETPQLKQFETQLAQHWKGGSPQEMAAQLRSVPPALVYGMLGGALLGYLFFCYCAVQICVKTGHPPGPLIWVPLLQMLPLLRAAGMPAGWFLAMFVPVLNVVATVLWSLKIARARGKSAGVGILLLLPVLNVFAFLYLAFSDGSPAPAPAEKKGDGRVEVMTLDAS